MPDSHVKKNQQHFLKANKGSNVSLHKLVHIPSFCQHGWYALFSTQINTVFFCLVLCTFYSFAVLNFLQKPETNITYPSIRRYFLSRAESLKTYSTFVNDSANKILNKQANIKTLQTLFQNIIRLTLPRSSTKEKTKVQTVMTTSSLKAFTSKRQETTILT